VTRLEIAKPAGQVQAWVPLPAFSEPDWFRPAGSNWTTNAKVAEIKRDAKYGAEFLYVAWSDDEKMPVIEVTSKFATRDRAIDLSKPGSAPALSDTDRTLYTAGTALIPVNGIVKQTSDKITAGATSDLDKARRIYEWIVDNTFRDPKTRGCGIGDIASMLKTGNLVGKCADLNALYVGLARAAGLPARDVYGLRVAPSKFGYKSLGAGSEVVTKAQHCRAEVYLAGFGWVPVDPADVRKVVLEESPGNLPITDAKVTDARKALFGAWEMNWLAYSVAHDLVLPGAKGSKLEFLMYPQAETIAGRLDCLDPDTFTYKITSKELTS
jgi:transglutaminase-like putative cysteine protease